MNERTDARSAPFVRPKLWQMIKRQLDAHNGLLAQPPGFARGLGRGDRPQSPVTRVFAREAGLSGEPPLPIARSAIIRMIVISVIAAHPFANSSPCRT